MSGNIPEIDGRSLWEVVIRMDAKLDVALTKLDDHEIRIRAAANQADVDRLETKADLMALELTALKNAPYVTPRGMLAAIALSTTTMVGLITLLNQFIK